MEYIKLYTAFRDEPKVLGLSDAAYRLHIETLLWVGDHETDGVILGRFDPVFVEELVAAGLWDRDDQGLRIHAWERYNRTHAEMQARRDAGRTAAAIRWGNANRNGGRSPERNANRNGSRNAGSNTEVEEEEEEEQTTTRPDWHPDSRSLAEQLRDRLAADGVKVPSSLNGWTKEAHLLLDRDNRDVAEVRAIIDWTREDEFWSGNIHSMAAVRKHFDKLKAKRDVALKKQRAVVAKTLPDLREQDW